MAANGKKSDGRDRREARRVPVTLNVRVLRSGLIAEVLPAELLDVSCTGLRIAAREPLICGESLLIEVRDGDRHCCNLTAYVVWIEQDAGGNHTMGCELRVPLTRRQVDLTMRAESVRIVKGSCQSAVRLDPVRIEA